MREFVGRLCERNINFGNENEGCPLYMESNDDWNAKVSTWVVNRLTQPDQITLTYALDTGLGLQKRQESNLGNILDVFIVSTKDDYAGVGFTFVPEPNGIPVAVDTNPKIIYKTPAAASSIMFSFVLCLVALFAVMY